MSWLDSYFSTSVTSLAMAGDVTGTTDANTVSTIGGLAPSALPLGGDVTGTLGASVVSTIGGVAPASLPLAGDVVGTLGTNHVWGIGGGGPPGATVTVAAGTILQWNNAGGALLKIADTTSAFAATGHAFTIQGQSSTAIGPSFGGDIVLNSGHGASPGHLRFEIDSTLVLWIDTAKITRLGQGNNPVVIGTATSQLGAFGHSTVGKPTVTGMTSAIVDPAAKQAIQTLVFALGDGVNGIGFFTDSTT